MLKYANADGVANQNGIYSFLYKRFYSICINFNNKGCSSVKSS